MVIANGAQKAGYSASSRRLDLRNECGQPQWTGCQIHWSATRERRQDCELIVSRKWGVHRSLREIQGTERSKRNASSAGERPYAHDRIRYGCRTAERQLEGIQPQTFCIAPKEENSDGEWRDDRRCHC
jgi:hypothetical protein